jgi:hypothetical protein
MLKPIDKLDLAIGFWPFNLDCPRPFFRATRLENGFQFGVWRFFISLKKVTEWR